VGAFFRYVGPARGVIGRQLDDVVMLQCGSRRCPGRRVGEVFGGGTTVKRTCDRGAGAGVRIMGVGPASVRLPCSCGADWNVSWSRLDAAYAAAVVADRRVLVLGVDL
jgi:hypothetical protein